MIESTTISTTLKVDAVEVIEDMVEAAGMAAEEVVEEIVVFSVTSMATLQGSVPRLKGNDGGGGRYSGGGPGGGGRGGGGGCYKCCENDHYACECTNGGH
ncbi:hypothetical protein KY290_027627 [Solanum tuberosum]|uniref:CCHC-type domain-containing protein n=1 Tax=Solanum tuberosum TaxID=4113 RepID=A0ABQ7UFL3_SOLTU|nr:hypothetical protein KY285_026589 [Solanum tuberosum]KAH0748395.1 hypothetical protein KY290_027627 [Solanum tuberosum]